MNVNPDYGYELTFFVYFENQHICFIALHYYLGSNTQEFSDELKEILNEKTNNPAYGYLKL